MSNWIKISAALIAGAALGGGLLRVRPAQPPAVPAAALGAVPPQRESLQVLKYLLETRPDARSLWFVAWWPPVEVADNPFTHEPATAVRLLLRPGGGPEDGPYEPCIAFVKGNRVLGTKMSAPEIRLVGQPQARLASAVTSAQE